MKIKEKVLNSFAEYWSEGEFKVYEEYMNFVGNKEEKEDAKWLIDKTLQEVNKIIEEFIPRKDLDLRSVETDDCALTVGEARKLRQKLGGD
jgi:regulator of sigma D